MSRRDHVDIFKGLVVVIGLILTLSPVSQADNSANGRVGFTILPAQTLTVLGQDGAGGKSVTSTFIIPTPSPVDLQQGFIERAPETTLVAISNTPWAITVRSLDADMGRSDDGRYVKPISDLQVRVQGGPYVTISPQDQVIAQGLPGQYEVGVDYRVRFDRNDYHPGNYHITLIYTIAND